MTGRLVKQATLVRQSSLHLINKKMMLRARHALALSVSEILTAWYPPDGAPRGSGTGDRDDRQAASQGRRPPPRPAVRFRGLRSREVLDYLRKFSGPDIPRWVLQAEVSDALTLNNWLWWEDRRRELFFLKAGRARGCSCRGELLAG